VSGAARKVMLIRHPETEANVAARYIGRMDSPITARGVRQTAWLAEQLGSWGADVAYTSPLGRALSTAHAIVPAGVPTRVLDDLQEIDFGDVEGLNFGEIQARGIRLDYASGGPIAPGGESATAFDDRVRRVAEMIAEGPERSVIVTHGGVMRRLLVNWLGLPGDRGWRIGLPNAAVAVVRLAEGAGVLESLTPPPELSEDHA